jgi:hypothetical protein
LQRRFAPLLASPGNPVFPALGSRVPFWTRFERKRDWNTGVFYAPRLAIRGSAFSERRPARWGMSARIRQSGQMPWLAPLRKEAVIRCWPDPTAVSRSHSSSTFSRSHQAQRTSSTRPALASRSRWLKWRIWRVPGASSAARSCAANARRTRSSYSGNLNRPVARDHDIALLV